MVTTKTKQSVRRSTRRTKKDAWCCPAPHPLVSPIPVLRTCRRSHRLIFFWGAFLSFVVLSSLALLMVISVVGALGQRTSASALNASPQDPLAGVR